MFHPGPDPRRGGPRAPSPRMRRAETKERALAAPPAARQWVGAGGCGASPAAGRGHAYSWGETEERRQRGAGDVRLPGRGGEEKWGKRDEKR